MLKGYVLFILQILKNLKLLVLLLCIITFSIFQVKVVTQSSHQLALRLNKIHQLKSERQALNRFIIPPIAYWAWFVASLAGCYLVNHGSLQAQITTDNTTGTQVNTTDNITEVTGGTRADSNLFHSFQDFSLETGNTAFLNYGTG